MNKVLLIILDGVGWSEEQEHNAIALAHTPYYDQLLQNHPFSLLRTDGESVGLPVGVMGNSEVGHLSIGAGRILYQDLQRIDRYSQEQGLAQHPMLQKICAQEGALHIMGLVSDGGVHSHIAHLQGLLEELGSRTKKVFVHMFTDGRDTAPTSAVGFAKSLETICAKSENLKLASAMGRFYAMDRDKRWERTQKAYQVLVGEMTVPQFATLSDGIANSYQNKTNDEFIEAFVTTDFQAIGAQDQVLFINFRADRARQLSAALAAPAFSEFSRSLVLPSENFYCFSSYSEDFSFPVLFPKESPRNGLGECLARQALPQLRIAETEKYAHVTFFFNGGEEKVYPGEKRILIDSPRDVKTYDEKPEMSAPEVTDALIAEIEKEHFAFIVVNYANGDMVGHTGNEPAAIKAMECLDQCLGRVVETAKRKSYEVLITADHGNVEQMRDPHSGQEFTQHSTNPVPLIWVSANPNPQAKLKNGGLADVAPTILKLMEIEQPIEMTGQSLID